MSRPKSIPPKTKSGGTETRTNLLAKIKFLEDELSRGDSERTRLVQQLDKVCEEKDQVIQQLKGSLYEKQMELDHQINLFNEQKNKMVEEMEELRSNLSFTRVSYEEEMHQLADEKLQMARKLQDLKEYMDHKEETMEKIRNLEEELRSVQLDFMKKTQQMELDMDQERKSIRVKITQEVEDITRSLEDSCVKKLSRDSKLALDKLVHVSAKLEQTEKLLHDSMKDHSDLKDQTRVKTLRLEVAESLLAEFLKQIQRKINARKSVGVQVHLTDRTSMSMERNVLAIDRNIMFFSSD